MNKSCQTYEWVMSHVWMSHVTYTNESYHTCLNESCHIYQWVLSHIWKSHGTRTHESWHTCLWVPMSHVRVCQWVMWEVLKEFTLVMSHTFMSHVIHWMKMNASCHAACHIRKSHVTHIHELCHTYEWVMSHVRMSHITRKNQSLHT